MTLMPLCLVSVFSPFSLQAFNMFDYVVLNKTHVVAFVCF